MMKKLSKPELKQRDEFADALEAALNKVCDLVDDYNARVKQMWQPLEVALSEYNGIVDDAQNFRDGIVEQMQNYIDERSEHWQESDTGIAYVEWKDSWEALSVEPLEIEQPEEIELPEVEGPEALRDVESEMAA